MASIVEDLTDLSGRIGQLTNLPVFDGTYSKVYRGEYANRTVAVKVLKPIGRIHTTRRKILRERVIWVALNHPNILPLIGYAEGDERFEPFGALISPWCINGDAARFLEERGPSLSLEKRIMLWEGVVQGVDYLHNLNPVIVHGDLKPANVLLDGHENPRICDFGLARLILEEDGSGMTTTSAHTGTERYLAYELVASDDTSMPTMESDIHALGCMGLDFIFLQLPYSHRRNNARGHIFLDIRQGVPPAAHPGSIGALEESYWNIIASCWSMDPVQRPVTGALLADLHAAISPQIWTTSDDHLDTEVNDASNALFNASIIKQNSQPDKPSLSIPNSHLWIHNVPKEVADTLSSSEKERQEAINELIRTERDFVRDMEYLRDVWVSSIRNSDVIPAERREEFISHDFWKILAILDVNTRLRDALTKRQKEFVVVGQIGDIFQEIVPLFDPFVEYGTQQMYAKYKFEKEKARDPAFAALMDEIERLPESRKLELDGYLTKPTMRLAWYPVLLEAVSRHTPDSAPDKALLQDVIKLIRDFLYRLNQRAEEAEHRLHLNQLELQLTFKPGTYVNLHLGASHRKMVYKSSLSRRGSTGDKEELHVFLFDHALLIVKPKAKENLFKAYLRPIPLEFLVVSAAEGAQISTLHTATTRGVGYRETPMKSQHLRLHSSVGSAAGQDTNERDGPLIQNTGNPPIATNNKSDFPITFTSIGRRGYTIILWAGTSIHRKELLEHIRIQQGLLRAKNDIFETITYTEGYFTDANRVNCAAPFRNGRRIVYGTNNGVYLSDLHEPNRLPIKVLALDDVTQVDILEDSQLLIVLAERSVITFPLDVLNPMDPTSGLKRGKRIAAHTSFFKTGICMNRVIVCVVKTSALSTTVKTFEPIEQSALNKSKPTFKKLLQGGNDTLKLFKEFYIPVESHSLSILRSRLCIGVSRGFQILDLESLETQPLVDPSDPSLEFIDKKDNLRPLAIFRVDTEILLCYDEWAVFVDRRGFRARGDWQANWEGHPTAFAFHYPHIIAIEPSFIEIWDIVTCSVRQVIPGDNLRCLFAESSPTGSAHLQNIPSIPNAPFGRTVSELGSHSMGERAILLGFDDRVISLKPVTLALPGPPQPTGGSSRPSGDAQQ